MSHIRRDDDKSLTISNPKDDNDQRYQKKKQRITTNLDSKVYVGNVPTEILTDNELLDFFKPFGKISDIRVYKGYLFVQYDKIDDARKLIQQGQTSLILKGNQLDILPAMEASSTNTKSSSTDNYFKDRKILDDQSSRNSRRYSVHDRHSSNYEPPRKRYPQKHLTDQNHRNRNIENKYNYGDSIEMEMDDGHRVELSSSQSCSRRLSRSPNGHSIINQSPSYTILTGPDDPRQLVDCQIIIVNPRQRGYGEEIESRLRCHGITTSIVLLREDYTLTEAIENASHQQCFYGIIAMPMHEERRTASFHILYGETEEHRNLTLEDGYHIILTNFSAYKERIRNEELNCSNLPNNESIVYSQSSEYIDQTNKILKETTLTINDKLPLSMLLCLLADGRQLTLDEIDRVLVYLLEKKSKMLTLPSGTLPPLPVQYATSKTFNQQTGCGILSESKSNSSSVDSSSRKCSSSELSATIAEQIRQILSTNIVKPTSLTSTEEIATKNSFDPLPDYLKVEGTNILQSKNNFNEPTKEYNHHQQLQSHNNNNIPEQQNAQPSFSYSKSNPVSLATPSFHYSSSSNGTPSSFAAPTFSSYDSIGQSLTVNSPLKQTTPVTVSDFISQPSQYFYPVPPPPPPPLPPLTPQNVYQSLSNSAAADAAAAIFQAYSQFNARSTPLPSIVTQQTSAQQQIRK